MTRREAAQQALEALDLSQALTERSAHHAKILDSYEALRTALADTQDWDEIKALRASLREHMAEIHRLRAAGRQALDALEAAEFHAKRRIPDASIEVVVKPAITGLRDTLSWDAMQRLTDVQQEMEQPVTDCHDKEGQVKHQIYEQALKIAKTDAVWWRKKNKIQQQNGAPEFALQGMLASLWLKGFYAGVRHEKSQRGNER